MPTQTGAWEIEYFDPNTELLVPMQADFDQLPDELNGDSNASFYLPNTSTNRWLVGLGNVLVNIYFNNDLQYSGILTTAEISSSKIKAIILDTVILMLDEAEPITGVYDAVPANQILTEVLAAVPGTNLTMGNCPTTAISVVFYKANRLDIVKFLAEATASEYWTSSGTTISIGTRGSNYWGCPERLIITSRNIDSSKVADKVIIRGIDTFGRHITGEAGSSGWIGARVRVFNEDTPADQATLINLAVKKLTELQQGAATGSPVSTLITMGYQFGVGDYIQIYRPKYLFTGQNYRIVQLTKTKYQASFQLDRPKQTVEKTLAELRNWEKNGIYLPGCTSWSINLQNLVGFYHLTEGIGTVAKDSSPVDTPADGTIVNGHWDPSPIGGGAKVLALQGDGYVDCTTAVSLDANASCFSVGGWFSPVNLDNTVRFLAHKDGQFALAYLNTVLRFNFTDTNNGVGTCDSDAGKIKAYGRLFAMVTYDGNILTMYINGIAHKTWTLNIGIHASTNKVYLGMFLWGNLNEMMFWTRCLTGQEVLELYFFPLNRVVQTSCEGS
jgi:hypothetical protein